VADRLQELLAETPGALQTLASRDLQRIKQLDYQARRLNKDQAATAGNTAALANLEKTDQALAALAKEQKALAEAAARQKTTAPQAEPMKRAAAKILGNQLPDALQQQDRAAEGVAMGADLLRRQQVDPDIARRAEGLLPRQKQLAERAARADEAVKQALKKEKDAKTAEQKRQYARPAAQAPGPEARQ